MRSKKTKKKEIKIELIPVYVPDAEFQERKKRNSKSNRKNGGCWHFKEVWKAKESKSR